MQGERHAPIVAVGKEAHGDAKSMGMQEAVDGSSNGAGRRLRRRRPARHKVGPPQGGGGGRVPRWARYGQGNAHVKAGAYGQHQLLC